MNTDTKKLLLTRVVFPIAIIIVFIILYILFLSFQSLKPNAPEPIVTPTPFEVPSIEINASQIKVIPDNTTTLVPGTIQSFTITFDQQIDLSKITVILLKKNISDDKKAETISISRTNEQSDLLIKTSTPITPFSEYTLVIQNNTSTLLSKTYLSDRPAPSKVQANDPALIKFLPFETKSYKLSYDPTTNTYIFNFIYDPASSVDPGVQFTNAKNAAFEFIKSKGVNPDTIVIEWKSH